jgi:hypothetical protein
MRQEDVSKRPRSLHGYSSRQLLFLLRALRFGALYRRYAERAGLADSRALLIRWAMRSTLADCAALGIEKEALALMLCEPEDR